MGVGIGDVYKDTETGDYYIISGTHPSIQNVLIVTVWPLRRPSYQTIYTNTDLSIFTSSGLWQKVN